MNAVHFSSASHEWRTPAHLFDDLHAEFGFTVDACATHENWALSRYWTEADEPLLRTWSNERVFMNPPYGKQIKRWLEKAWNEATSAELIVALVPSRTDTAWWHDYAMSAGEIRFLRRRLTFEGFENVNPAPFPSCILIWKGSQQ
jgi:phage N-6-adenine-methyltransferase